jgi:predicted DNA-binding transcriptional regulator AlpA
VSEKLDSVIAVAALAASIPVAVRWLDSDGVGAMLGYSGQHVRERLACRKDFPKPARIDGGHARWRASEIDAWMERVRKAA